METKFEIERGVPMPKRQAPNRSSQYPFAALAVGDSFLVPAANGDARKLMHKLSSAAAYQKHSYGRTYSCRTVDGGIRVWRTA